jgi:hypothetical protein
MALLSRVPLGGDGAADARLADDRVTVRLLDDLVARAVAGDDDEKRPVRAHPLVLLGAEADRHTARRVVALAEERDALDRWVELPLRLPNPLVRLAERCLVGRALFVALGGHGVRVPAPTPDTHRDRLAEWLRRA